MSLQSKRSTKIQQTGGTLVAVFETANPPLIWKFDLERNHSFALALQGEGNAWQLGVTTADDKFHPVARFTSSEDAEEAFLKTQRALLVKKGNRWRTATWCLGGALALTLFFIVLPLLTVLHSGNLKGAMGGKSALSSSDTATPGQMKDGVPMDADQVLRPPP